MHLEGQFDVNAEPAEVYAFLTDPRRVSSHMPDVTSVDSQDGRPFQRDRARRRVAHQGHDGDEA